MIGLGFVAAGALLVKYKPSELSEQNAVAPVSGSICTQGFVTLSQEYSMLDELRKSLVFALSGEKGKEFLGSAVLIDEEGTIALCAHEDDVPKMAAIYKSSDNSDLFIKCNYKFLGQDPIHDVALAQLVDEDGLPLTLQKIRSMGSKAKPICFGQTDLGSKGETTISCGYFSDESNHLRLHAAEGKTSGYNEVLETDAGEYKCMQMDNVRTQGGMSGGIMSNVDGQFLGLLSSSGPNYSFEIAPLFGLVHFNATFGEHTAFVPIEAILKLYQDVCPTRYIAGIKDGLIPPMLNVPTPKACSFRHPHP
jgi:hypothetical protein